jgi:hypothetical protein
MLLKTILLLLVLAMSGCAAAWKTASCIGCDTKYISKLSGSMDKQALKGFFCTIQADCIKTNVEFGEFANEFMFEALGKEPALFMKVFVGEQKEKQDLLLQLLETPVHDGINIDALIGKMVKVNGYGSSKAAILSALRKAKDKL